MRLLTSNLALIRTYLRYGLTLLGIYVVLYGLTEWTEVSVIIVITALFGFASGAGNVTNQTALYRESPAEKVGTASGLLRTFGYIGSIASATITGLVFRTRVDDAGLHSVSLIMIGIGIVVLLMTALDRQLARADRTALETPATGAR